MFATAPMPDACRTWFDCMLRLLTKVELCLVLIRAAQLTASRTDVRNPRQVALAEARHDVRVIDQGGMRAVIGGRLRRAVTVNRHQTKDFQARADKLIRVLKSLDVWAARIAHRSRAGMTRLLALHTGVALPLCNAEARSAQAGQLSTLQRKELRVVAPP